MPCRWGFWCFIRGSTLQVLHSADEESHSRGERPREQKIRIPQALNGKRTVWEKRQAAQTDRVIEFLMEKQQQKRNISK
jgi:hypothetical protein